MAVSGTFIGKSADNGWLVPDALTTYPNTVAWRADITSLINHGGPNKTYSLDAFNNFPSFNPNGASIIILYNDSTSGNDSDVYIYNGNDGNSRNAFDSDGWFAQLSNFEYGSGTATVDMHVADGQFELVDADVRLNNQLWLTGNHFKGFGSSALWDILPFTITSFVQPGNNNLTITSSPVSTLDGLNLIVAVVRVPPVREVKSVTWEVMNSAIDDNPNTGGGKRIFPDMQSQGDTTNRQKVRVRAETTMGSGQTVFFKSFDVDEPGTDALPIDTNGTAAGGDNRGEPKMGTLNVAQATTDSNGVATIEFTTTMQPGDNFMVAASRDSNYLNGVVATGPGLKDSSGNSLPTLKAKTTPMLTVWRRLHIEVDSMGLVDGNRVTGNIVSMVGSGSVIGPCNPKCPAPNQKHMVTIDKNVESNRYNNSQGKMTIGNVIYNVDSAGGNTVTILTPGGVRPVGSTYTLVDDDDYNFNDQSGPLDGDQGEDVQALADTFSLMQPNDNPEQNIYAPAYIRPVYDGGGDLANNRSDEIFFENVPLGTSTDAQMAQNSVEKEKDAFWVVYVQLCYQGPLNMDMDLNTEFALLGITDSDQVLDVNDSVTSSTGVRRGGEGSLIYLETMRDAFVNAPLTSLDVDKRTVPHEVGHQFGLKGDIPSVFMGIMSTGVAPNAFNNEHLNIMRWRIHSPGRPLPPPLP